MTARPNLLFLFSDQHTQKIAGCYGDKLVRTPNLDRLAAGGVTFDNVYCPSPICLPSRMSMLTARHPFTQECWTNDDFLASDRATWVHAAGAAGYRRTSYCERRIAIFMTSRSTPWIQRMLISAAALVYVVFFPILYNTLVGVRTVPQVLINATLSLGASGWQVLTQVILPSALPNIITGFRVGAGFAFRGLIFAEIIAAKSGIGFLIFEGASNHQTARTIVGMIVMGLLWLAIDNAYLKPIERVTVERWGSVTTAERRE